MERDRATTASDRRWNTTFVVTIVAALIASYGSGIVVRLFGPYHHFTAVQFSIVIGLRETIALAIVYIAAVRYLRASPADFGLVRPRASEIILGIVLAVVFAFTVTLLIDAVLPSRSPSQISWAIADGTLPWRFVVLLVVGVYSPFVQELVFRPLLLNGIVRPLGAPIAIVAGAAIFGLVHAAGGLGLVVNTFAFGLVQGILYVRFRSLTAPIAMHVATNTLGVALYIAAYQHAGR
jgi:membrane protease YdiL (CAAX protease family)